MRACITVTFLAAAFILAPAAVWSLGAGDPAELMEPGCYQIGFEWLSTEHLLAGQEYLSRGYLLKAEGNIRPRLDIYLRVGQEGLTVRPRSVSEELRGDRGLSLGGGLKLALFRLPRWEVGSFLDLGAQTFRSEGTIAYEQDVNGIPSTMLLENDYRWRQLQAAWGFRREQGLLSPFAGVSLNWLWLSVDRRQLTGSGNPTETGSLARGPRYRAFGGLDVELSRTLRLSLEMSRRLTSSRPWFTIAISERTR